MHNLSSSHITKDMRIYLSGGVTGIDNYKEMFAAAEEKLKKAGYRVLNPTKINDNMPEDSTHDEYMHMSYAMMDVCDAVYFLNGWRNSLGANQERGYAQAKKMPMYFEKEKEWDL